MTHTVASSGSSLTVDQQLEALRASAAAYDVSIGDGVLPETAEQVEDGSPFTIKLLIPEELESGDGRTMAQDALSTRDLPLPLLWQPATGDGHNNSYIVGRIDSIDRVDGGLGNARGVFDVGPYGREAERLVRAKMLRGVSADLDKFEATIDPDEPAAAELADGEEPKDVGPRSAKITSEKMTVNKGRVMAATLVAKPAFQECTIELGMGGDDALDTPDGTYEEITPVTDPETISASLVAAAAPVEPPLEWFRNPTFSTATPLTVDDDGRVYGHIASWSTNHIGFNGKAVKPPKSRTNYAYFRTGVVRTADGEDVAVGQLTLAGGHAPLDASAHAAVRHYDDTASAVADVAVGEDQFGIWVAGGLRPGATPEQVRTLRASAPSGDWRPINNSLELVAVCQVNVPGFPIARARVASGAVMALVAAGAGAMYDLKQSRLDQLSARVDALESAELLKRKHELVSSVEPLRRQRLELAASAAREAMAPGLARRQELAQRAADIRSQFKLFVPPEFKDVQHPRDDHGKFRQILARLEDAVKAGPAAPDPVTEKAVASLSKAADLEDAGNHDEASKAAGDAAGELENAATSLGGHPDGNGAAAHEPGTDGHARASLGDVMHKAAQDIAHLVSPGTSTSVTGGPKSKNNWNPDVPEWVQEPLDQIVDELGEGVDPTQILSRLDSKVKQWLTGKGFRNPEDLAKLVEKKLQRPVQPGATQ